MANVNQYDFDTLITITGTFVAADGVTPVDPSTVTLYVRSPDGVRAQYTGGALLKVSTGVYSYQVLASQTGRWSYKWVGSGSYAVSSPDVWFSVNQSTTLGV